MSPPIPSMEALFYSMIINESNFKSTISSGVVMVDCYADWCRPCNMMAPVVDKLTADFDGRATVGKMDVGTAPTVATEYGVSSIPTFLFFKDGKFVDRLVGMQKEEQLRQLLEKHIMSA